MTYGILGYSYTSVEEYVNAEFAYRQAMLLQPDSMEWQMGPAQTLFKREKYTDFATLCRQMIKRDPENADVDLNRSISPECAKSKYPELFDNTVEPS